MTFPAVPVFCLFILPSPSKISKILPCFWQKVTLKPINKIKLPSSKYFISSKNRCDIYFILFFVLVRAILVKFARQGDN